MWIKTMNTNNKSSRDEPTEYPKIITVKNSDKKMEFELDITDFLELIKISKIDVVFRDEDNFFLVKEGCCFYARHFGFFGLEELVKAAKLGFRQKDDYNYAIELGITNFKDFSSICNKAISYFDYQFYHGDAFNRDVVGHCKEYIKASKLGFQNKSEYDETLKLGFDSYESYTSFKKSGFDEAEEYFKAKKLGFNNESAYEESISLGFNTFTEYQEFLESGCKNKKEFDFSKKIPQIIKNMNKKLKEIVNDADSAFKTNRFEEFIRLKFLSIERMADIKHLELFKQERLEGEDVKVDEIINQIESKLEKEFTDHEELKYWRRIRNKIIHEHLKLDKERAEKGKEFFDELYNNLSNLT